MDGAGIMKNIMRWLVPKEERFFEMLTEQAEVALESAKELKSFVNDYEKIERNERKSKVQALKNIEKKADEIKHRLIEKLNKNSAVPIDKEDIRQMAVLLDDVVAIISIVASRFVILGVERTDMYIVKFTDMILEAVSELGKSILGLRKLKDMKEHYSRLHSIENEADKVYDEALSELFHFYKNSIDIIKYKEIYELLERAIEKCENVADVIENIVAKHA